MTMKALHWFFSGIVLVAAACGDSGGDDATQGSAGSGGASKGGSSGNAGTSGKGGKGGANAQGGTGAAMGGMSGADGEGGDPSGAAAGAGTGGGGAAGGDSVGGAGGAGELPCAEGGAGAVSGVLGDELGSLELYGTFHSMGVIATLPGGSDADGDAVAHVEYRLAGTDAYEAGFPLTRVASDRFVGSLFWLTPGTAYDVRVWYSDPDGAPLDSGFAQASASTRDEIVIPAPLRVLHVAPGGTGTACSVAVPCALAEGVDQAIAGDEVRLDPGVYYEGGFVLPSSGSEGAPIVFRGTAGATILDGADPASFTWAAVGGGVYSTSFATEEPGVVTAGVELFPYASLPDLTALSAHGLQGHYADGVNLYVHLSGGADPTDTVVRASRFNNAFYVAQDFVYFVDLTFQNYGQGAYAKAIYLRDGSDNLVQGCHFVTNELGVGLKGDAHRNVIQDSEFENTRFDWVWEDVKSEGYSEQGGIGFYDPVDGRGNVVRRNTFHDSFDGFSVCPGTSAAVTNETDVYDNYGYALGDDGMETDGQCANVRIWGNTFSNVLSGISLAPAQGGPVYCLRNVIARTGAGTSDAGYTGMSFKFNSGLGASGSIYLFHNTVDAHESLDTSAISLLSPGSWQLVHARNNAWVGLEYAIENQNGTQPIDFDYDLVWASEIAYWSDLGDEHFGLLDELITMTGQEAHGVMQPPLFTAQNDFTPLASSALVDAALRIPGVNDDFNGCAPDIGAVERP